MQQWGGSAALRRLQALPQLLQVAPAEPSSSASTLPCAQADAAVPLQSITCSVPGAVGPQAHSRPETFTLWPIVVPMGGASAEPAHAVARLRTPLTVHLRMPPYLVAVSAQLLSTLLELRAKVSAALAALNTQPALACHRRPSPDAMAASMAVGLGGFQPPRCVVASVEVHPNSQCISSLASRLCRLQIAPDAVH